MIIMKPNYFPAVINAINPGNSYRVIVFVKETTVYLKDVFIPKMPVFHLMEHIQFFMTEEKKFVICQVIKKDDVEQMYTISFIENPEMSDIVISYHTLLLKPLIDANSKIHYDEFIYPMLVPGEQKFLRKISIERYRQLFVFDLYFIQLDVKQVL